jgi:hypothetical protein
MHKRTTPHALTLLALLLVSGLIACDDSNTGPEGPSVAGIWNGEFRGASAQMNLTQAGSDVSGTLTVGPREYPLIGTVDATGTFEWSTDLREADCSRLASSDMQLQNEASSLAGRMVRSSESPPCDGGRTLVQSASVELTKAF